MGATNLFNHKYNNGFKSVSWEVFTSIRQSKGLQIQQSDLLHHLAVERGSPVSSVDVTCSAGRQTGTCNVSDLKNVLNRRY